MSIKEDLISLSSASSSASLAYRLCFSFSRSIFFFLSYSASLVSSAILFYSSFCTERSVCWLSTCSSANGPCTLMLWQTAGSRALLMFRVGATAFVEATGRSYRFWSELVVCWREEPACTWLWAMIFMLEVARVSGYIGGFDFEDEAVSVLTAWS